MTATGRETDRGGAKEFLVTCEACGFERRALGREAARRTGNEHRRETGHELLALELPARTVGS